MTKRLVRRVFFCLHIIVNVPTVSRSDYFERAGEQAHSVRPTCLRRYLRSCLGSIPEGAFKACIPLTTVCPSKGFLRFGDQATKATFTALPQQA